MQYLNFSNFTTKCNYNAMIRNICTVPLHNHENGISILYHLIVDSQLNSDNLTRSIIYIVKELLLL